MSRQQPTPLKFRFEEDGFDTRMTQAWYRCCCRAHVVLVTIGCVVGHGSGLSGTAGWKTFLFAAGRFREGLVGDCLDTNGFQLRLSALVSGMNRHCPH